MCEQRNAWAEQVSKRTREEGKWGPRVSLQYLGGLCPWLFFFCPLFTLYQVARIFHFVSSLDLREGQVTPLRGVTNSNPIQSGREVPKPSLPTSLWLVWIRGRCLAAPTPVCDVYDPMPDTQAGCTLSSYQSLSVCWSGSI